MTTPAREELFNGVFNPETGEVDMVPLTDVEYADWEARQLVMRVPPLPVDPLVPASVAVDTAVAAAMATVTITSPNLTQAQKDSIESQVQTKVQDVITQHLEATAPPA